MATLLCLKIPDDIKERAQYIREQKKLKSQDNHLGSSRSPINNVLDLSDMFEFRPTGLSTNNAGAKAEGNEEADIAEASHGEVPLETTLGPEHILSSLEVEGGDGADGDVPIGDELNDDAGYFNEETGERPCGADGHGTQRTCCQYRTQMKYILRELQCLANKVHGDDKKDSIKKYA